MLTTDEVLDAFDAIGDSSMHNQVLKNELNQRGYEHDAVASAIEAAIAGAQLVMTPDGFVSRSSVSCVARFKLTTTEKSYLVHGNSDGSWVVAEYGDRVLAGAGVPHPSPMKVIKTGQSTTPGEIAVNVGTWARSQFGPDVLIESI
ncbi:hypothetical protein C0Q88_25325 [Ralstonia pickettii]|uniref:Uncharacterized protein n=1 Tax=Ralstonia pickettii TaxID=329 RepID=A0A2N4TK01_RALPI|nr:hypothetical protein [Ralstonia pickettii]PLC40018.1 hypothetical protein C0Q88_25325 [Ralstonia pickettii]